MSTDDRSKDPWADFDTSKWYDDPTPEVMAVAAPPSRLHFGARAEAPEIEIHRIVSEDGQTLGYQRLASPRPAQAAGGATGADSPLTSISREALASAWHYDERLTLTIPAQPAAECGHITPRRWTTATGEWCENCYVLAVRVLGGRP